MADNVVLNAGAGGATCAADEVADGTLGTVKVQFIKIMDGTLDGTTKAAVGTDGLKVDPGGAAVGSLTETAPATDTASSGLNGRLQRVAQRLTSLIALLPAALGTGGGLKVDGSGTALPVSGTLSAKLQDGGGSNLTSATRGAERALSVQVVDASGTQVTAFGGSATIAPATSGGLLRFHLVAASSTNATNIKASAGQLYAAHVFNAATYPIFVKFHNTAGTPTAGSGVVRTIGVQAGTQRDVSLADLGSAFSTGIGITIVKDIADAGTTAVAASDCVVDVDYF